MKIAVTINVSKAEADRPTGILVGPPFCRPVLKLCIYYCSVHPSKRTNIHRT